MRQNASILVHHVGSVASLCGNWRPRTSLAVQLTSHSRASTSHSPRIISTTGSTPEQFLTDAHLERLVAQLTQLGRPSAGTATSGSAAPPTPPQPLALDAAHETVLAAIETLWSLLDRKRFLGAALEHARLLRQLVVPLEPVVARLHASARRSAIELASKKPSTARPASQAQTQAQPQVEVTGAKAEAQLASLSRLKHSLAIFRHLRHAILEVPYFVLFGVLFFVLTPFYLLPYLVTIEYHTDKDYYTVPIR